MKITCIGGGPAGLYFALLMRQSFPDVELEILERNRPDDTYGWGVVFSDETLSNFELADPTTYAAISASFRRWDRIETHYRGRCTVSTGHGFAAISRQRLLHILAHRCRELGVTLRHQTEVRSLAEAGSADLIVAADGIASAIRTECAEGFRPRLDEGRCRFAWFGTTLPMEAFTFLFHQSVYGWFQVHAYPFDEKLGTWIVECHEDVWRKAGLDHLDEAASLAFCEELFADFLGEHRLLGNRSIWRAFTTVRCERWYHGNVVLLGDAAHTAHFSIGSGTKLAMEDAIALRDAFVRHGTADLAGALASYQEDRWVEVVKLQKAAQTSLEWFENSARYLSQPAAQLTFNLMTRSKRITYDDLRQRDPALVAAVDQQLSASQSGRKPSTENAPPPVFLPFRVRDLELGNRIVVSPMCQYSATDGVVGDWHLVHLGSRAVGGAGLVLTEMTDVTADGRISPGCAGLYHREHIAAWRRIVEFVHRESSSKIGIQLAHAGRKGSMHQRWRREDVPLLPSEGGWQTLAPTALPFRDDWPTPKEMKRRDMEEVRQAFVRSTRWAEESGFDWLELHMAHGYLLSSFLSPLSNRRSDDWGGSLESRMRFPLEVFRAVREAWPASKPISVRISATDWLEPEGMTVDDSVVLARQLAQLGCDVVDVSSAGNDPRSQPVYGRMYQVPFAERIRHEAGVPVMAVGGLLGADHANTVIAAGRADLAVMARPHLRNPYLTLHAAELYGVDFAAWPAPYLAVKPPLAGS